MGLLRGIGRAVPVIAAGLALGRYLRRKGLLGGPAGPDIPWPQPRAEQPQPPAEEPEPGADEPEGEPMDAHVEAVEAVSDAADVTAVVEDLLAVAPSEERDIADAEVVEGSGEPGLAASVRVALAQAPAPISSSIRVVAAEGVVWLRGELERPEAIAEAEQRAASVPGVIEVRNLLQLRRKPPSR
jgi:BON domain